MRLLTTIACQLALAGATGDVFDSFASSLKSGALHLASTDTSVRSAPATGPTTAPTSPRRQVHSAPTASFDGSCLCPAGGWWNKESIFFEQDGISVSCGAAADALKQALGQYMDGEPTCHHVALAVDEMKKNHADEMAELGISDVEGKCCDTGAPVGGIVGGVLGGVAVVGIGLAIHKKKGQRSDYAEMPK
jgi:hypothetical protein